MKSPLRTLVTLATSLAAATSLLADPGDWKPLFNANDLDGWVNVNGAPETWSIKDGLISCTGKPVAALRSIKHYENFELELEWRHLQPSGNAGIFVWASALPAVGQPFLRAIEVQVLENAYGGQNQNVWFTTHGDIFPIHGATMTPMRPQTHQGDKSRCFPSEFRSKPSPEWNHYRMVARDGSIRLSVNGKEVSGGDHCVWRKGYLGLESEGSPTEWRNLRIKELPSSSATTEESAPVNEGWRPLYNGVDLRGWKADDGKVSPAATPAGWAAADWVLQCAAGDSPATLRTDEEFGDIEIIVDSKVPAAGESAPTPPALSLRSSTIPLASTAPGSWQRHFITIDHGTITVRDASGQQLSQSPLTADAPARGPIRLLPGRHQPAEFANIFVREKP
jgi:hypothetical protein